jgi:hypothetical protein
VGRELEGVVKPRPEGVNRGVVHPAQLPVATELVRLAKSLDRPRPFAAHAWRLCESGCMLGDPLEPKMSAMLKLYD